MYVFFSDWNGYLWTVPKEKNPEIFIKIYALENDPRVVLTRPQISVFKEDSSPFTTDDAFNYGEREIFSGEYFENRLKELAETSNEKARALIRFAKNLGIVKYATSLIENNEFKFQNPLDILHGLDRGSVHLDILRIGTFNHIKESLGISFEREGSFVSPREIVFLMRNGSIEGVRRKKELI